MDLSSTVLAFSSAYTVTRHTSSTVTSEGYQSAGTSSTVSISACFQPATGKDLARDPEGRRTEGRLVGYTPTELKVGDGGFAADVVSVAGENYEVEKCERWAELGGYWRVIAKKVE